MAGVTPRIVLVTRPTMLEALVAVHGTRGQARFFLQTRHQSIEPLEEQHALQQQASATVRRAIPRAWRSVALDRKELARFVFEPQDLIVAVGQDGLVANVAKYLDGQRVIGVNPDAARFEGVLVRHAPSVVEPLLHRAVEGEVDVEARTMVQARTDDGQILSALNEIYVGHRTHQSARYAIRFRETEVRHSSSGLIVATGTGATGWARSIHRQREVAWTMPRPTETQLIYLVREAWPSVATSTEITDGVIAGQGVLTIRSEMNEGGVLFGDGIEADAIALRFGTTVHLGCAPQSLNLVRAS